MLDTTRLHPDIAERLSAVAVMEPGQATYLEALTALEFAQSQGGPLDEFWARVLVIDTSNWTAERVQQLPQAMWLRGALESGLDLTENERLAVLWRLKWAADVTLSQADLPLERTESLLDDLDAASSSAGFSPRSTLLLRAQVARERGREPLVQDLVDRADAQPVDALTDCPACEAREVALLLARRDPEHALHILGRVIPRGGGCNNEPALSYGYAALLAAQEGRSRSARAAHRRGWRRADHPHFAAAVGAHLLSLRLTGRASRARRLLEPRMHWEPLIATDQETWYFTGAAAAVLNSAHNTPPGVEAEQVLQRAQELSRAFDQRNGTSDRSETLARWIRPAS